jgi:hypothetical protein
MGSERSIRGVHVPLPRIGETDSAHGGSAQIRARSSECPGTPYRSLRVEEKLDASAAMLDADRQPAKRAIARRNDGSSDVRIDSWTHMLSPSYIGHLEAAGGKGPGSFLLAQRAFLAGVRLDV